MNKKILQSIWAVVAGFLVVAILSTVMDLIVEKMGILPRPDQPEAYLWWHWVIALAYRGVFTVMGGYLTAKLAPSQPMRHVVTLAVIGTILGSLGTIANWNLISPEDAWYPMVLLIISPVCVWLGGRWQTKK